MMLLRMLRMRRAGGYSGSVWLCCWLLGWQAAALQLPPCEEVRFSASSGFSPSVRAGEGYALALGGGWYPSKEGYCWLPRAARGMAEGSDPRGRTLSRGSGSAEPPASRAERLPGRRSRSALRTPLAPGDRCSLRYMEIAEFPLQTKGARPASLF